MLRTDHQALVWLFSMREPKARTARWIEILSAYDFVIEYRAGIKHGNADGMSRCNNPRACSCSEEDSLEMLRCGPCDRCKRRAEIMAATNRRVSSTQSSEGQNVPKSIFSRMKSQTFGVIQIFLMLVRVVISGLGWPETNNRRVSSTQSSEEQKVSKSIFTRLKSQTYRVFNLFFMLVRVPMSGLGSHRFKSVRAVKTRSMGASGSHTRDPPVRKSGKWKPWSEVHSIQRLAKSQREDPDIGPVYRWIHDNETPTTSDLAMASPATRHYYLQRDTLLFQEGILLRRFRSDYLQYIVPRALRNEVLYQVHNVRLSGHLGVKKTKHKAVLIFFWFEMRDDISNWVRACDSCAEQKLSYKRPRAPLGDMRVGAPLDRLSTDVSGPFPLTSRGNRYILTVTDHFTRWVEIFAIPDQTAETCANKIFNDVVARYGCPYELLSDQGRNYESSLFKELCRLLEI